MDVDTQETELTGSPDLLSCPPVIAAAIIAVMENVTALKQDSENLFDKYKYTSTDAYYEAVGTWLSQAGLNTLKNEVSSEIIAGRNKKGEETVSTKSVWDFYIIHKSGAVYGPLRRSIIVPQATAQATGSAQSYIEKYFLRDTFKIPSGEGDEITSEGALATVSQVNSKSSIQDAANKLRDKIKKAKDLDALNEIVGVNDILMEDIRDTSETAHEHLVRMIDEKEAGFQEQE